MFLGEKNKTKIIDSWQIQEFYLKSIWPLVCTYYLRATHNQFLNFSQNYFLGKLPLEFFSSKFQITMRVVVACIFDNSSLVVSTSCISVVGQIYLAGVFKNEYEKCEGRYGHVISGRTALGSFITRAVMCRSAVSVWRVERPLSAGLLHL